jgi:hypothetical protein
MTKGMRINHQVVAFDAATLAAESSLWAALPGGTVDAEDDCHMVFVDGKPRVGVQLAPDHIPPDRAHGTPQQQIHLDLWADDIEAVHDEVISFGAKLLTGAVDSGSPDTNEIYADPAGHLFGRLP